ncbi:MAG: type I DNA topoisomerase [Vallitaleaceae bacterium]|jgi:DNA topoisomerase-1|nr:type I DNA topoisomerase [Vallitaleaceae bacterium]
MAKNLVIVESPAKAKTIKKFLGANYKIEASMGHVRDLPKSQMGVDVENDFEPKYITIRGKGELLAHLRKEVKKASKVYLATDPDREGEAISWHLLYALKLENKPTFRISFNEITKIAIKSSILEAREIDMDLVDAQQARRMLDRIVGYRMSALLWKKVKKGLSAGRVQSLALRLICDRENDVNAFIPEEYWSLEADLYDEVSKDSFTAKFYGDQNAKMDLPDGEVVQKIIEAIKDKTFEISDIKEKERSQKPYLPFTTSTLQQEAAKKLNYSPSKTMRLAQQLYEGIDIVGNGTIGLITYLRTDSTRISDEAHLEALAYIETNFGEAYANPKQILSKKKGKVQDAHEAVRPTTIAFDPKTIKASLSRDQYKLYKLIYDRFISSRMMPARYARKSIQINVGDYRFTASLSTLIFDGFLKVYDAKNKDEDKQAIANITRESILSVSELIDKQHFTQPPARFSEASLIKTLEENGVGRPSTYAPTIGTIMARGYVIKEEKILYPSELGSIVDDMLRGYFEELINVTFTADLESKLDQVEEGLIPWKDVIREFYPGFNKIVLKAEKELEKVEIKDVVSDVICELCGTNMVIKLGKYGKFLACPTFPECRNTKPLHEKVENVLCPKCSGEVLVKKTKKGRKYFGCENNPECDFMTWQKPSEHKCEKCGSMLLEKGKKLVCYNDECKHVVENI